MPGERSDRFASVSRAIDGSIPLLFAVAAGGYALGSVMAWWVISRSDLGAVFFAPAGLTFVLLLRTRRSRWPVIWAAIALAEVGVAMTYGSTTDPVAAGGFALANIVEPTVGALIVRELLGTGVLELAVRRHLAAFALGALGIAPAIGATIASTVASIRLDIGPQDLWFDWWLGDALGVLVVAPLLMAWSARSDARSPASWFGIVTILSAAPLATGIRLSSELPLHVLVLAPLLVAGAFFGVRTIALTGAVVAVAWGAIFVVDSSIVVGSLDTSTAFTVLKLEMLAFIFAAFVVASEAHERELANLDAAVATSLATDLRGLLLPQPRADGPGFSSEGLYSAAKARIGVGGDWYSVRSLPDGRVLLAIGDVVGHDVDAARAMAELRAVVAVESMSVDTPEALLERLDRYTDLEPVTRFGSAWIGLYRPDTGELRYASAGHPAPLLVEAGATAWLHGGAGPLLGVGERARSSAVRTIDASATVVMFTDGLVERRGRRIDIGLDRLRELFSTPGVPLGSVVAHMLDDSGHTDDTVVVGVDLHRSPTPV